MNKVIFFVAGGTGGHLFPAIAVAKSFEKSQSHFLVDKRTEKILLGKDFKYHVISSSKLEKNIFTIIISIFKIFYGFVYSFCLIIKFKPSLVVGFGGYTSIPTILAAKVLNKKILIHEQNSVMGKTNRFLSKISTKIAITYKNTMFANEFGTTSLMRFGRSHTTSSFLYGQSARIWPAPCSTRTSMIASGYFLLRFLRKGIARTVSPIYRLRITSIRFFRFCCLDFIRITFCLPP